ncbi:hypothetical protein EV144_107173 [Flavobacterium sp. 270]|uniref:hypothetical protein n=1 Tax=Flavobacterium sp. 270 TaxID=2512114 RepID=UPI0010656E1C|nr:hypothetical protein [Flavobacterium sp. 270]TDW45980.1 hypothetical protein EV144_107173 [Flavobacterium sp. 270]
MEEINNSILKNLKETENEMNQIVAENLNESENETYLEFYNLWKNQNRIDNQDLMYEELKLNIEKYWLLEKYNNDIQKKFNMLYFEHGGLYGGDLEAYAIDFNYSNSKKMPDFEVMDDRFEYLDNISSMPAFVSPTLYHLTKNIQGEEGKFDDFLDVNDIYNLFESTALIEINRLFERADNEKLFEKFNFKKPFYLAIGEHDAGAPKLVYVID